MTITKLNPYLNFNGAAEKALKLYEQALGAKTEHVMRYADVPGMPAAPEQSNRIMHAMIRIGDAEVMLGDNMPNDPATTGTNVAIVLHFDDVGDMTKKFDALAKDGKVNMPIHDTFWGAKFGVLVDAFGVLWMFNCQIEKAQ